MHLLDSIIVVYYKANKKCLEPCTTLIPNPYKGYHSMHLDHKIKVNKRNPKIYCKTSKIGNFLCSVLH